MHDLFGREKPSRLPRQLDIAGATREFDYQAGERAYWPPGNEIAIFYAHDGQTIPQPGLAREFGATDIVTERGHAGVAKIKDRTRGLGTHSVIEAVSTQESMLPAIGSTRPGGHLGDVGVAHGSPAR